MKDILDTLILILFAFMVFAFIRGFNRQQINKYTKKLEDNEKREEKKDKLDD